LSNVLFLISGPSGSGKTTILRTLMSFDDNSSHGCPLAEIVSFTTRPIRPGEVDGIDYHFITVDEFHRLHASDSLIEWSQYGDNFYGVQRSELDKLAVSPCYFICDVNGMRQFRHLYDRTVSIFIYTDIDSAAVNLVGRGESEGFINRRIATYESELSNRGEYDYVVRNNPGRLGDTIDIVRHIIDAEVAR
jgi:guanylate kinase